MQRNFQEQDYNIVALITEDKTLRNTLQRTQKVDHDVRIEITVRVEIKDEIDLMKVSFDFTCFRLKFIPHTTKSIIIDFLFTKLFLSLP